MPASQSTPSNQPDEDAIRRHLELLAAPAVAGALKDGLIEIAYGSAGPDKAHLFVLSDLHLAVDFAARVNRVGNQVYVGAALRKPGTPIAKRTSKASFYGAHFSWLDDAADWRAARAAWTDCPPDLIVCTGRAPAWRGQLLWRFPDPITDPEKLEAINRGIEHRLGGDDVHNADRLLRLAGTINWPVKPGRTVPELVTLKWTNGAGSATDFDAAWRVYATPSPGSKTTATGGRTIFGQVDLEKMIAQAGQPGQWHAAVRDTVMSLVGRRAPDDIVFAVCRPFTQPGWTWEQTRADVAKMLEGARAKGGDATFDQVDDASASVESPLPLLREMPPATPYPIDALGPVLTAAARGIADIVQAPLAMCGQSVLGAAALAVQSHVDVTLPTQQTRPASLYLLSIAATGERKSACDREALWPIRQHEANLRDAFEKQMPAWQDRFDLWKAAREKILKAPKTTQLQRQADLAALGPQPVRPLDPVMTTADPTIEGLIRLFGRGQPSIGIFTAEGGQFIGSYAMSADNRLRSAANYSELWDGETIKRVRASEDTTLVLSGRRVSAHLMAQPDIAAMLLSDSMLAGQGLLSRILLAAPDSLVGGRLWHEPAPGSDQAVKAYGHRLLTLLEDPAPLRPGKTNELQPRELVLTGAARLLWIEFADQIEHRMAPGGDFESIRGLANKLAEHATRIAGVLAVVDRPKTTQITDDDLAAAIELALYHAGEAQRLHGVAETEPDLLLAQRTLEWLRGWPALRGRSGPFSLREVYRNGPRAIRNARIARRTLTLLEEHGCLKRESSGGEWVLVT